VLQQHAYLLEALLLGGAVGGDTTAALIKYKPHKYLLSFFIHRLVSFPFL
jgi:hypothetical protein